MGRGLCLGPAQKGRGSTSKGGSLEFGGKALGEGVWVGFRPSVLEGVSEGVSECRGGALGGGVGAGLGLCVAAERLRGQRIRLGTPTGFPVPMWAGKALAAFPSCTPLPHCLPQGLCIPTGPLTVRGSRWV